MAGPRRVKAAPCMPFPNMQGASSVYEGTYPGGPDNPAGTLSAVIPTGSIAPVAPTVLPARMRQALPARLIPR